MIAPASSPAPRPQPHPPPRHPQPLPRHCTVSTLAGAAFLTAAASAIDIADAAFANDAMLTATKAVAASVGTRFLMGPSPLLGARRPIDKPAGAERLPQQQVRHAAVGFRTRR